MGIERTHEVIRIRLYQGAYAQLWMSIRPLGTSPIYWIVDQDTNELAKIEGVNWNDLKDVMQALQIYEYEKMEEYI